MTNPIQSFYAHGKLLITGEYFVLDGAKALAVPTQFGQKMTVSKQDAPFISWQSFDQKNELWFEGSFDENLNLTQSSNDNIAQRLKEILHLSLPTDRKFQGFDIKTTLEFDPSWGLGTSSTLISNIAQWTKKDPYTILKKTFGGSGYDLAAASSDGPIIYSNKPNPHAIKSTFNPSFKEHIYFIFLNQKQNSRQSINHYKTINPKDKKSLIKEINTLTDQFENCLDVSSFISLIETHENLISTSLKMKKVKDLYFKDFQGAIKSLGGWGGDFIMASSIEDKYYIESYFQDKAYEVVISYDDMILGAKK